MAKELDLIMNPKAAPAELSAAVNAHQKNYNQLVKAQTAKNDANAALKIAQAAFDQTQQSYLALLDKWEVK